MRTLLSIVLLVLLGAPVWTQTNTSIGLENGVYSSLELGFRYRLPPGLSDETSYARESLQKKAADLHTSNTFDVLLRVTSGPDDSVPEWHAISIQSYSRAKFVDRADGAVEARMNQLVAGAGTSAVGKSERESIAGISFSTSNFEKSEPPLQKYARVYSTVRKGKVLSIAFTANLRESLDLLDESLRGLEFAGATPAFYLGFDRNEYPGDQNLKQLRASFAYTGYWLNNPPGSKLNSWAGKRDKLEAAGFGYLVLFNGRLFRELRSVELAAELGKSDAQAALRSAGDEGFPAHTILFLDQEEGGRLLPEQKAYLFAWVDRVRQSGFRAGVYCSGIAALEKSGESVVTAEDIRQSAGTREITYWVTNDACPPSPGCSVSRRSPSVADSGVSFADVWQFAESPRRKDVASGCRKTYAADGNCYVPGAASGLHVDLNTSTSADPSHGRTQE
jgi:hypothetical protein